MLLFVPLLVVPDVLSLYGISYLLRNPEKSFDGGCKAYFQGQAKSDVIAIGYLLKRKIGRGHVPIVRLVVNEGAWVSIILFGIITANISLDVAFDVANPFIFFAVSSTLISVLTCRIIRSMHSLAIDASSKVRENSSCDDDAFRLTTIISTDSLWNGPGQC
ncbi:hypothetical protein BJ165DRAFT_1410077 [Panaeolus papilionaceus]|nr:hypothetical protein BJ165DRAFT_1410077 [Panaeolus papilionaceus]